MSKLKQWGWWSDGFGWQREDTALVAMTLGLAVLCVGAFLFVRI